MNFCIWEKTKDKHIYTPVASGASGKRVYAWAARGIAAVLRYKQNARVCTVQLRETALAIAASIKDAKLAGKT